LENLKKKADLNIKAAKLLIKNEMYNPSVHCSYYGAFQMTMAAVCETKKIKLDTLKEISKSSHIYTINAFFTLKKESHLFNAIDVRRNLASIKNYRQKADYKLDDIIEKEANKQMKLAEDTIALIKKIL
jgi:uncharacterized protein (UPF0332 family)